MYDAYTHVKVEGLAGGLVQIFLGTFKTDIAGNGRWELTRPTEKGFAAQAELCGIGEVSVTLEKS